MFQNLPLAFSGADVC